MMKIKYIFCLLLLIQSSFAFATAQYSDRLIYNGKKYSIFTNPMEKYFNQYPEKRPKPSVVSSALWRGYIATFEIIENELWVIDIEIEIKVESSKDVKGYTYDWKSVIDECIDGEKRKKVDWFNGLLVIPQGELIEYVHMGYGSIYEKYLLIEIMNGNFIREYIQDYKEYHKIPLNYRDYININSGITNPIIMNKENEQLFKSIFIIICICGIIALSVLLILKKVHFSRFMKPNKKTDSVL